MRARVKEEFTIRQGIGIQLDSNIRFSFWMQCNGFGDSFLVFIPAKVFGIFRSSGKIGRAVGTLKTYSRTLIARMHIISQKVTHSDRKKKKAHRRKSICELKIFRSWSHAPIHHRITGYGKQI